MRLRLRLAVKRCTWGHSSGMDLWRTRLEPGRKWQSCALRNVFVVLLRMAEALNIPEKRRNEEPSVNGSLLNDVLLHTEAFRSTRRWRVPVDGREDP